MNWNAILNGIIDTAVFSMVGIVMMAVGFFLICLVTPFSIKKEIEDDQNVALGIIIGAVILGISIIIASVISSPSAPQQTPQVSDRSAAEKAPVEPPAAK